jgi:hypothetical protein
MRRSLVAALALLAVIGRFNRENHEISGTTDSSISIKSIILPQYPQMARLAGDQGVVYAKYAITKDCQISGGPPLSGATARLRDSVGQTLAFGGVAFSPCDATARAKTRDGKDHLVALEFTFSLQGEPSNKWCPTRYTMQSAYEVEISTCPPDWAGLGLMKIPVPTGSKNR